MHCKKMILLLICCILPENNAQTVQNVKDLRTELFTTNGYDNTVRPAANQSRTVNIYITYRLLNLNELNELQETMKTTGYLFVTWNDSQLTWTPATYGGIVRAFFPQGDVWVPDLTLKNSYADQTALGSAKMNVVVDYTGQVHWYPFQVFTSTCSIDITDYPFDVQNCALTFVSWSYDKNQVMLYGPNNAIDLSEYEVNPLWSVVRTTYTVDDEEASISLFIKLKRKAAYTVLFVVLPIIMLTAADLFVFVLPCESGERAGYAVTVFLSFVIFMTIVESNLPKNSDKMSLFSIFVVTMTAQSTVITLIALGMLRLTTFDHETTPVPSWLATLARLGKCDPCKRFKHRNAVNTENKAKEIKVQETEQEVQEKATEQETTALYSWKEIINGLDVLCFVVFAVVTILVTVICLSVSAVNGTRA